MPMPPCLAGRWPETALWRWVATTPLPCRRDAIRRAREAAPGSFCLRYLGRVTALLDQYRRSLSSERVRGAKRPLHSHFGPLPRYSSPLTHDRQRSGPVIDLVGPETQGSHRTSNLTRDPDGLTVEATRIVEQRLDRRGSLTTEDKKRRRREDQAVHRSWHDRSSFGCIRPRNLWSAYGSPRSRSRCRAI